MDVSRGHYEVKIYGLSGRAWGLKFSNLLQERYGIIYPAFAGCIVTDSEIAYKNAYNSVSRPGIIRHFRHDVFAECEQDAKTDYEKQITEKNRAAKEKQRRIYKANLNTLPNK